MIVEVREKNGIKLWYYDFWLTKKHSRGWLLPPSEMTKRQAIAAIDRIKAEIITEVQAALTPKKYNIKDIFDSYHRYLEEHGKATLEKQGHFFKNLAFFHPPHIITAEDIITFQRKRKKEGVSGATINRELQFARAAFNRAKRQKIWLGDNPFSDFDHFAERERNRFLSEIELSDLLIACRLHSCRHNPYLHEIVLLAILTGRRKQEILKLHKSQIDWNRKVIVKKATGSTKYLNDIVTPISDTIITMLIKLAHNSKNGYLFENPRTGQPFNGIKRAFSSALKSAAITDFRFHDLRHAFCTYALLATEDIRSVQATIGHASIQQTMKYTHVLEGRKREVMESTEALISTCMNENMNKQKED